MKEPTKPEGKVRTAKRAQLIATVEDILIHQGHAALSARHLSERSGIKFQSIYYYFENLDGLFLEVLNKSAEKTLQKIKQELKGDHPLRAMWNFHLDSGSTNGLMAEFGAMAKDNARIREALRVYSEDIRALEISVISDYLQKNRINIGISADILAVLLASVTRNIRLERAINIGGGHRATEEFVETLLAKLEAGPGEVQAKPRLPVRRPGQRAKSKG